MTRLYAFLAAGAAAFIWLAPPRQCGDSGVVAGGKAAIGGPFTMVNHLGETVTEKDVITGPTLIYFGYTFCPDVCPLDTARNAEAIDLLDEAGIDVTPVFITIDPERDTVAELADYVEVMHPKMIGLTGSLEQVDQASQAYKTYYRKRGEGENYLVDHSSFSYLMGEDGLWAFYRRDVPANQMADQIACHVKSR